MFAIISVVAILTLTACASGNKEESTQNQTAQEKHKDMTNQNEVNQEQGKTENMNGMDHSNMNHTGSAEVPEGLQKAKNPTFPVGSKAIIQSEHMGGMKGAEATIVGAYDTTVYTVSYTPTNGGALVTNHKWVIQEELEGVDEKALEPGTEVTINANHMEGMKGATAKIDSAEKTTVFMVDYTSTTGEKVTNHKWVTESELSAQ